MSTSQQTAAIKAIGASLEQAQAIFILPTPPKGRYPLDRDSELAEVDVKSIIAQDGNHWRKILTIMAKLCCNTADWRNYRDRQLLTQHERIEFETPTQFKADKRYFICGHAMQQGLTELKASRSLQALNEKGSLLVTANLVLCPYLDYRQFPNADIEAVRLYQHSVLATNY